MSDTISVLGITLPTLSTPLFVAIVGLAVFAYERGESRARARDDGRWLLGSLAGAVLGSAVVEIRAADGFGGLSMLALEALVASALVGVLELGLYVVQGYGRRAQQQSMPCRP